MSAQGKTPPRVSAVGCWPVTIDNQAVGELTSCCYSPTLEQNIAYIYLNIRFAQAGQQVSVETPEGPRAAALCELPFIKNRAIA
ncbi:MAG: glycine cleavage T C-terminal barrel domain-containing protein [Xanthomonadales bacterium]|nr:glycine cleavage T C-terminal barrel domain-containing protein [Xanthomonadales bacterium]